jgi:hypothetical protein
MVVDVGLTDEQRYLLDMNGYLLIRGALSEQEVQDARAAVTRMLEEFGAGQPPGSDEAPSFASGGRHGEGSGRQVAWRYTFAYDKCLERLAFHPGSSPALIMIGPLN